MGSRKSRIVYFHRQHFTAKDPTCDPFPVLEEAVVQQHVLIVALPTCLAWIYPFHPSPDPKAENNF